ncbi:hypothetical protein ACOSQ2_006912 [Xanthoceras sorbifolium]
MNDRDVASWTIMVSGLVRAARIVEARELFEEMPVKDVQAWNVMIAGYVENGDFDMAEDLYQRMPVRDLDSWKQLINGLVYSGKIDAAIKKFMEMPEKCQKTWNLIILGFIRHGLIKEAHAYIEKCPYSNIVSWTNVIVGYFEIDQIRTDGVEVPPSVWGALFGACRIHKNIKVGEIAGERILEVEPSNSGIYLILAEMYLSSGRKEDAEKIWARMKGNGIKKQPGCSWIEINNSGKVFLSGDRSHPEFRRICFLLNLLHAEMETKILKPSTASSEEIQISFDGCYG